MKAIEKPEYDPSAENESWVDVVKNTPKVGVASEDEEFEVSDIPEDKEFEVEVRIFPKKKRQSSRRLKQNLTLKWRKKVLNKTKPRSSRQY